MVGIGIFVEGGVFETQPDLLLLREFRLGLGVELVEPRLDAAAMKQLQIFVLLAGLA